MLQEANLLVIRLIVFGGLTISIPGKSNQAVSSKKALALLTYLSLAPGMVASRDKLADLLWPDRGTEQARNSLRQTLAVLRRELGPPFADLVVTQRESIGLASGLVDVDALHFLDAVKGTSVPPESAVDIYRGPFLDGFFSGSQEFEDWAAAQRERFLSMAVDALDALAQVAGPEAGLAHARRLLALNPTREASYQLAMRLNAANGHRDTSLQLFDTCRKMLRRVFGVDPSSETLALRDAIASGSHGRSAMPPVALDNHALLPERMPVLRVLNFVDLTGAGDPTGFLKGLTADIITAISRQGGIVVMAEPEPQNGESSTPPIQVQYMLSGTLQTMANRIRVNTQLIDVIQGTHVWAERYDGSAEEALDFQDSVSQSIAIATRIELLVARWNVRDRTPSDEPDVRILVRRAMIKYYEFTRDSIALSLELAKQAVSLAPDSPRAMRTLSLCTSAAIAQGVLPCSPAVTSSALRLAETAVSKVPEDEIGRCVLSWALANVGRSLDAVGELRHAIAINPEYPTARSDLAEQYAILGRPEEAIAEAREAMRLGSVAPIDFWRHYSIVMAQFALGNYEEALQGAHHVMKRKPGLMRGSLFLAASAAAAGQLAEAQAAIAYCRDNLPDLRLSNVAPGILPRYVQDEHHHRFLKMLGLAGLPD